MITVLRKIRRQLVNNRKPYNYLKYAFGEVILVVIGILIALSINNWNEDRKEDLRLRNIFLTLSDDIKTDTLALTQFINGYEILDSIITVILEDEISKDYFDTINETNYQACIPCQALNTSYATFYPQTKGYELLKSFEINTEKYKNSIAHDILLFYNQRLDYLDEYSGILADLSLQNVKSIEQYQWYYSYMSGKFSRESITYFSQDKMYKNRLATFKLVAIANYLRNLKEYKDSAATLLNIIENQELNMDNES